MIGEFATRDRSHPEYRKVRDCGGAAQLVLCELQRATGPRLGKYGQEVGDAFERDDPSEVETCGQARLFASENSKRVESGLEVARALVGRLFEFSRPSGQRCRVGIGDALEQPRAVTQESRDHGLACQHASQPREHVSVEARRGSVLRPPFEERRR